jgi:hypothetical protein
MSEPDPVYTVPALQIGKHRLGPYVAGLTCKSCGAILASVTEFDHKTVLILFSRENHPCLVFKARLVCRCGAVRMFYSAPISGIRLGVIDG